MIDLLKIRRELSLIRNRIKNKVIDISNTDESRTIKNRDILEKDIELLVNYYNHLDNITITQYNPFNFVIIYRCFHKNKLLLQFNENMLPDNQDRYSMNILILSKTNISRHKKFKVKDEIYGSYHHKGG